MKPTEWIKKIENELKYKEFNSKEFVKSCPIYSKGNYGIFLLEKENGEKYTVKLFTDFFETYDEVAIALYVKEFAFHIPNILHVDDVTKGHRPSFYPLFKPTKEISNLCKEIDVRNIFNHDSYFYYLTKACSYNLGSYMGVRKGTFTYEAFVNFTFMILVAIQTLHRLGIWHKDIKPANLLLCESNKKYDKISYTYNKKIWTLSYETTNYTEMKLIDYGESKVVDDILAPCTDFALEVNVAIVAVIKQMWNKTNKKNLELYEDLIFRLEKCTTSLIDIMMNAPIFFSLYTPTIEGYEVDLL